MAKEFLQSIQDLSIYAHKQTATLFLLPTIEAVMYVYKSNPVV